MESRVSLNAIVIGMSSASAARVRLRSGVMSCNGSQSSTLADMDAGVFIRDHADMGSSTRGCVHAWMRARVLRATKVVQNHRGERGTTATRRRGQNHYGKA